MSVCICVIFVTCPTKKELWDGRKKVNGQPYFLMSHMNLGGPLLFWRLFFISQK